MFNDHWTLIVNGASNQRRFELELLEPRCLLSGAALVAVATPIATHALLMVAEEQMPSPVARQAQSESAYDAMAQVGSILPAGQIRAPSAAVSENGSAASGPGSPSESGPAATVQKAQLPAVTVAMSGPASYPISSVSNSNAAAVTGVSQVVGSSVTEQLTTTLKAANGPPTGQNNPPPTANFTTFSQGPEDRTVIKIGGPAGPGVEPDGWTQINVSGLARLDGTLKIELANGFVLEAGQRFKVITWGARTGEFSNWLGTTGIPGHPDHYFKPIYNANDLTIEVVEDPDIISAAKTAIQNGLNTLGQIGNLLNNIGSFAQNIPLIGDKLSGFINSGSAITNGIAQQIQNFFASAPNIAEAAVTSFIQSWDNTSVGGFTIKVNGVLGHYDVAGSGPFWWDVNLDIIPVAVNRTLQNITGAALGATFGSAPSVQVTSKLNLAMGFGYDAGFFLKLDHLTASANVSVSGLSGFPFNLAPPGGPLSLSVTNGTVNLSAAITATPDSSILTPNAITGARISGSTLTTIASSATNVSNAFNLSQASSLDAIFTLNGNLTGFAVTFAGTTSVEIHSPDILNGSTPDVTVVTNGSLTVLNQTLTGTFTFKKTATETDLLASNVSLDINLGAGGSQKRILQAINGTGSFVLLGGDLAGTASLTIAQGPDIPGLTLSGSTLTLALNTSTGAVATVNGAAVNLPAGPYYRVSGHAILGLATPQVNLTGDFVFEPRNTDGNPANGNEETVVGFANLSFSFSDGLNPLLNITNGSGALVITSAGLYGLASANLSLAIPGISVTGAFQVLFNNTNAPVAAGSVDANGTTVNLPALVAGPYVRVNATGATAGTHAQLTVLSVGVTGDFTFETKTTNASHKVVTVSASNVSFNLGTVTVTNLLSLTNGSGAFILTNAGLAGQGTVTLEINAQGLTVGGTFGFRINQTAVAVNETVDIAGTPTTINLPGGPYLQVTGTGVTLGFLGATLTGNFSFEQRTSTTSTQLVTVSASDVSFSFGTSILNASNGSGFFVINDSGIIGTGQIDVHVNAFGTGFSHTFTWDFNNTDPAIDQTFDIGGVPRTLNLPDGPFNRFSSGTPVSFSVDVGGQPQNFSAVLVLSLVHPDSGPDYVTVGVSGLSSTLTAGPLSLAVTGGTGAFVIYPSTPSKLAGEVTVGSATLTGAAGVTLTATNLKLQLNTTGADVGPVTVSVSDNAADNVTIDLAGAYYHNYFAVTGAADLALAGFVTLGGNFSFEVSDTDSTRFKVGVSELHLDLKAGSLAVASFNHGTGAFLISSGGLAGTASLQFQTGILGMGGTISLEANTTNAPANGSVTINGTTTNINLTGTHYLKVGVNGYLRVGSTSLNYDFYVVINASAVEFWQTSPNELLVSISAAGAINLGPALSSLTNLDFARPDPFQFVSMLKQLGTWIDSFRNSSVFNVEIPFTGGKTLGDAFDWSQLFIDDLYSRLVSVELQSTTVRTGFAAFSTAGATFQLQLDSDTPVILSIGGIGSYAPSHNFNDTDIQTIKGMINTALATANLSNRVVARENLAGQLVIALTDSEVAKGTKLSLVAADAQMNALGFGPVDSNPATVEHVAALTSRYPTENPPAGNPDVTKSFFGVLGDMVADLVDNGKLDHSATGSVQYDAARQVYTYTFNLGQTYSLGASDTLAAGDFTNLSGLVTTLRLHTDPVSQFLWNQFTSSTQAVLINVSATVAQQESALISDLNRIIQGPSIYTVLRFPAALPSDISALLATNPTGSDLAHLNRLLLQDAYPNDFADVRYPLAFSFDQDFGSLAGASLSGALNVSASVGLQLTLGFDLSAKEVPRVLSSSQVPVPVSGQTSADSTFYLYINDDPSNPSAAIPLTLHKNPGADLHGIGTADNVTIDDLATDLNHLFQYYTWQGTALDQLLIVQKAGTGLAISAKDSQLGIINRLVVTSAANDTFATELGFGIQLNQQGTMMLSASNSPIKGLFVDNAHLTGSLSVASSAISGSLKLGFVDVSTSGGSFGTYQYDGTTPAPITASITLQDQTTGATRLYISDLMNGTSSNNILNLLPAPTFTGSFLARLNNISVSGLGFSLPLNNPQVSVWIPDLKNLNYNPNPYNSSTNREGLFVTYPSLGSLQDLASLNFSTIITALKTIADNLGKLSAFSFLNDPLPLIDMSVNDLIGYAAKFASLIDGAGSNHSQSLQDTLTNLKTQIDTLLHLDPDILHITVDDGGLYGLTVTTTGGANGTSNSTATINPAGDNNAFTLTTTSNTNAGDLNGSSIRVLDDPAITGATATATWDATTQSLTLKLHSGSTPASAVLTAVNGLGSPWTASLATSDNGSAGNLGNGAIVTSSLVTRDGVDGSIPAATTLMPGGDNNDFQISIADNANAHNFNGAIVRLVGDSSITDTSAQVSWDPNSKILTIKINPGQTTGKKIVDAIITAHGASSSSMPWTAVLAGDSTGSGKDGTGTITTTAIKFSLAFSTQYANSLPFQLNLQQLVNALGDTNPAIVALLQAATTLVQVGASGNLTVSASAALTLDFGLDLTNPSTIRPFFYDTTGVVLLAKVLGTDLNVQVSLGSVLGIFIVNGSLTIDGDGNPATNASSTPADKGAEFRLGFRHDSVDGRYYFDEDWFNSANLDLHLRGGVSATLPIFAPLQSTALGGTGDTNPHDGYPDNVLHIEIPDLVRLFLSEVVSTSASGANAVGADATILFGGVNNDLQLHSTSRTDYSIKFLNALSGNVANATFDVPSNTLIVNVDGANTTASIALAAIKTIPEFNINTALTSDDDGNPAAPHSNDGTGKLAKLAIITPDFSQLFNNLDFCAILSASTGPLLDGLDTLLGKIQDGLNSIVSSTKLPLIGNGLAGAANFIQDFRNGLLKALRDEVSAAGGDGLTAVQNAIKKAFWNTLGPGGLDLLVNPETGGALDASLGYDQLDVTLDCNDGLIVKLRLKKEIALVDTSANPIKFDIGVPGFGLKGDGNVNVSVGFDLRFGFGVSPEDGFYFDSSAPADNPELQIYFKVTIPSLHFAGQLLFLQLDIADNSDSPSIFSGHFSVDLMDPNNDGKLTWAEMTSGSTSLSDILHAELGADASVNLDLAASFGGNTAFPRVLAQFHLLWQWDLASGAGEPQIYFDHIYLDVGSFISDFLGPILSEIQKVTKPIQPIIDLVQARIPILSDLAGKTITLLTLAQDFGLLEPSTVDFIKDVAQVITLINDIQGIGHGNILIPFGSFTLSGGSDGEMSQISPNSPNSINLQQSINNDPDPGVSSSYQSATAGFAGDLGGLHNFSIPIFDHPSLLFNLFIGKPVALVEWRMPTFKFSFTYIQSIPIYPPLYAQFGGSIAATINIGFGYDTFGIQKFIDDPKKQAVDLLDGFYILTNDAAGKPQPALTLTGEIFAGASIDLVLVEAGVRGGISATINFFWNDNSDNDGKMRVSEIIANAKEDPRCIFNIEGKISLFLEAYLKIDLFFFSIDKTWRFANITLISFDLTCPEPVLGELSGSTLTLNMGSRAARRLYDDTSDGPEIFIVRHVTGSAGNETVQVTWAQHTQQFIGVSEVDVADAGQGDDTIDLRGVLATSKVNGGAGDDTIYLSDGPNSTATGGTGNDTIVASSASTATGVVIHGGDGNDTLTAGKRAITIYGDGGNDVIAGSPEADTLYGGDGADTITAGEGDDFMDAGAGNDNVDAGKGNDFILGGAGDDTINAGPGDDVVDAGDGNDLVFGGAGNDLLIGGNGNDKMYGDGGSDLLIGDKVTAVGKDMAHLSAITFANMTGPNALGAAVGAIATGGMAVQGIYGPDDGSSGNDFLVGGGGSDMMFGGSGNDFLYGGNFIASGDTAAVEEDGNDFIDGGPGDDTIFGDDSMGKTGDRNTGIAIKSSIWNDLPTGGTANGLRDSDEKGLGGVTVWLYTASVPPNPADNPGVGAIATTTTDVDGSFQFVGLDPNNYNLVFSLPGSFTFTTPSAGTVGSSNTDSDATPITMNGTAVGKTTVFHAGYDQTFSAVSAGYLGTAVVSIADSSVAEGNTGQTQMVFNITLSSPMAAPVEIDYQTANGNNGDASKNATQESGDYVPVLTPQKLIFNPGETSKQITILINGDTTYEANQQFRLQIVSAVRLDKGASLKVNHVSAPTEVLGTLLNDDPIPSISIQDYDPGVTSPLFGAGDFVKLSAFSQTLSAGTAPVALSQFVWSQFSASDQALLTSTAPSEVQQRLTLVSGLNTLLAGPSIYTALRFAGVTLSLKTSTLLATAPTGENLVLLNRLLLQDAYVADLQPTVAGDTEGAAAKLIVTLSNPSEYPITVDWRTDSVLTSQALPAADAATPSPLSGADYTSASSTLTFSPGTTTQVITVATLDDHLSEGAEQFWVDLYNPTFATITDDRGYGIIQDNDPLPSVSIVPVIAVGGLFNTEITQDPSSPEWVYFKVQLSAASGQTINVTWATSPGTAVEGPPGGLAPKGDPNNPNPNYPDLTDYVGFPTSSTPDNQRQLVFAPGLETDPAPFQIIKVQINPTKPYPNPADTRTFFINLLSADNANIAPDPSTQSNHVTVVIKQPVVTADAGPWSVFFSADHYDVQEPTLAEGLKTVTITIQRTPGSSQAVAVFYTTNGTATAGQDYDAIFRQIIQFAPGELRKDIPITIRPDSPVSVVEGDETVILSLRNPTGGPVRASPATATLTIHDRTTPRAWIEAPLLGLLTLGDRDFADFSGLVSKLNSHTDAVSLFLWGHLSIQTALASSPATIQTNLTTALNTILNGLSIYDATVFSAVTLSTITANWVARNPTAPGSERLELNRWLLADAFAGQINQPFYGLMEGTGGAPAAHDFNVYLTAPAGPGGVLVSYETVSLTARSEAGLDQDFQPLSGNVPIAWHADHTTISVRVQQDSTPELNETFAVRLNSATGATLDPQASGAVTTIYDDDLKTLSFNVFYDTNGNGFNDLKDFGIAGLVPAITVTYMSGTTPTPAAVSWNAIDHNYTADVLLGQVSLLVNGGLVKLPYVVTGPDSSYQSTTTNESQSITYQGLSGLPSFADVGYLINTTTSVDKATTKSTGHGGTDDTIYGGPGNDTIDAGGGDDHVVGGHWMTATDSNMPINQGDNHTAPYNKYDAVVKAITKANTPALNPIYDNGPVFEVDTTGLTPVRSIGGQIWQDNDNNGAINGGEQLFMQDVIVTLYDCNGNPVNSIVAKNGSYSFDNLLVQAATSDYVVQFDLPKGYTFSIPGADNKVTVGSKTGIVSLSSLTPSVGNLSAGVRPSGLQLVTSGFQFSDPSYSVSEAVSGGVLTITLQRGNAAAAGVVVVQTQDGTAHQLGVNPNYASVSTLVWFEAGETVKTVNLTIHNTGLIGLCADPLTFTLFLRDPTGKPLDQAIVYIGGQAYGTLHDDDFINGGDDWDIILGDSGTIPGAAVMNVAATAPVGLVYSGGLGQDTLHGGKGPDFINGQLGNDRIYGDSGEDYLLGDMGNDTIYVGLDSEVIDGGYGFDTVISTRDVPVIQLRNAATIPEPTTTLLFHKQQLTDPDAQTLATFTLTRIEMAELFGGLPADPANNVSGGVADNLFDISNWNGSAFVVGNGGHDTLMVNTHVDMKVLDATTAEKNLYHALYGFYKDAAVLNLSSGGRYDLSSIENVIFTVTGGVGGNTLDASGYSQPVTFKDLDGNNTFIGGQGDDTFAFNADSLLGTETITGHGGHDTIDFSSSLVQGVTVNLGTLSPTDQMVKPGLFLKLVDKIENVTGGAGNDNLTGNDLDNVLKGGPGTDTLAGGAGSETYVFDTDTPQGSKTIIENIVDPGLDTLDFSGTTSQIINVNLSIVGTPQVVNGNLTLTLVGDGLERVFGGALNDVIRGNRNDNLLRGGLGDDVLDGKSGDDTLDGGPGNNILIGGPGVDTLNEQGDTSFTLTNTRLTRGTGQTETLDSIEVANLKDGKSANVFNLTGWTGTGSITGVDDPNAPADDTLIVGADANFKLSDISLDVSINFAPIKLSGIDIAILTDGPGSHTLDATDFTGEATLMGGDGNDIFKLGGGKLSHNTLDGGRGTNSLVENFSGVTNDINFTLKSDAVLAVIDPSGTPIQRLDAITNIQSVTLLGGSAPGTDNFDVSGWRTGSLTLIGAGPADTVQAQLKAAGTISITDSALTMTGSSGTLSLSGMERATLTGSSSGDTLDASGFSGTASLHGGAGDDVLIAAAGNCTLDGGPGNDRFVFEPSATPRTVTLNGGDGEDTLDFSALTGAVSVNLATLFPSTQLVSPNLNLQLLNLDFEDIIGSPGGGTLTGNSLSNTFTITGGGNSIDGDAGTNTVVATANADFTLTNVALTIGPNTGTLANIQVAKLTTGPDGHTLNAAGFSGATVLIGGAGNDTLVGGSGNDLLSGGAGNDTLRGGPGNDTYQFNVDVPQGQDTVDELSGNGIDTLDFSPAQNMGVTVKLGLTVAQTVAPNLTLTLTHGDSIENVIGTPQIDYLTGNSLANTFTGNGGADDMVGGTSGSNTIAETRDADFVLTNTSLTIVGANPLFSATDIRDLVAFVARLQNDSNLQTRPISQFIWSQFSPPTQNLLTNTSVPLNQRQAALVTALNQVLQSGNSIFDATRFAGVTLSAQTTALLAQNPSGDTFTRRNRFLLVDTYQGDLAISLTNIQHANLTGGAGHNTLDAAAFTLGGVSLYGLDGNDLLIGGYGNDWLDGGNGDDVLYGGAGSDIVLGRAGNDTLDGCGYIDTSLHIPDGNDLLFGGTGNDTYRFDITARNTTPLNPLAPSIPQGTDTVVENPGEGYADTLLGLGPSVLAVNLSTPLPQNYYDATGAVVLTLTLDGGTAFHDVNGNPIVFLFPIAGQVEYSF